MKGSSLPVWIILILLAFSTSTVFSQSSIELVENKGQWDPKVRFKGELNTGAFFLRNTGFTVLLQHPEDIEKISDILNGHSHSDVPKSSPEIQSKKAPQLHTSEGGGGGNSPSSFPGADLKIRSHAYEVEFVGANPDPQIVPDKPYEGYTNFIIGNDPSKWKGEVKSFGGVTYRNVYPNIDVRYYSENGQLKYDILVHPGGRWENIVLDYKGVDRLSIKDRNLIVSTSVGEVKELYPYSYQVRASVRQEVDCKYILSKDNKIRFQVKNVSRTETLVIDPTLIFSTFSGSRAGNFGFTATYGPDGSLYGGGIAFGSGYPTTTGAFQVDYQGGSGGSGTGHDIAITKFSPTGVSRLYSTYIGGNSNEQPHSMVVDRSGNLVVMGRTRSSNFPSTATAGPLGNADIFVLKLNNSGTGLIGSLIYGGKQDDGVNIKEQLGGALAPDRLIRYYGDNSRSEVILGNDGSIFVAANTQSNDLPITAGAFQTAYGGGDQDGVILRINSNANGIIFSTYVGGNSADGAFVIDQNPTDGKIYVGGLTSSTDMKGDKTGVYQPAFVGGSIDGFLMSIDPSLSGNPKFTYMGTVGIDGIYGIKFDLLGFPYVIGTTTGDWPIIGNPPYKVTGAKQFICKVRPDLSGMVYSTLFGTSALSPNISPTAFLVDRCENVYVSGWGGPLQIGNPDPFGTAGTFNLPTTPDAIQSRTDGSDFYFFVLEKDAQSQLYGSFFGQFGGYGEHVDGGTSRFDRAGFIYQAICANCFSRTAGGNFPTTPGVVAPVSGNPDNCNMAVVKIELDFTGARGGVLGAIDGVPYDTVGCVPLTVQFTDTIATAKSFEWDFGDGSPRVTGTSPSVSHNYNSVGYYRVMMIAIDPSKCIPRDTSYTHILARNDQATVDYTSVKLPPCESLTYQFTNTSTPPPGKPFGSRTFTWDFGDKTPLVVTGTAPVTHTYAGPGTYNVKLILTDTSYCNFPDTTTKTIRLAPNVDAQFITDPSGCVPHTAVFENTSLAGLTFEWDFGDGTTSTDVEPTHLYTSVGTYRVRLVANDPATCNLTDTAYFTITVKSLPTAAFSWGPNPPVVNEPTIFTNSSIGAVRYKWYFGDGDSSTLKDPFHQYNATGEFQACLIAYNEDNCPDTTCQLVLAEVAPAVDVPKAFTPNGDGLNDQIFVRGYAIGRMNWRIYNRQGLLVFQSNSPMIGWDGRYKGAIQPMDAYAYTLEVEFTDGTRATKKGDITLIR